MNYKNVPRLMAIYDEDVLRRQILHNKLDHLGFAVCFSCSDTEKLFTCLKSSAAVLLLNLNAQEELSSAKLFNRVRRQYPQLKIILYAKGLKEKARMSFLRLGSRSYENLETLVDILEEILPNHDAPDKSKEVPVLAADHPFYKIVQDKKKFEIIKHIAEGKISKEIPELTGLELSTVQAYRKDILHEANCKTMPEVVAKFKDQHLI